jgi:hypothetical protein
MSFLLHVFWKDDGSMVENELFPGCSSLSALTYSSLADVQKFITHRLFVVSGSVSTRWKDKKLLYVFPVHDKT